MFPHDRYLHMSNEKCGANLFCGEISPHDRFLHISPHNTFCSTFIMWRTFSMWYIFFTFLMWRNFSTWQSVIWKNFFTWQIFSPQALLVMLVTNIRYVWAGGGGNVFVCIRALVCVGVLTCVSALDCVCALANVRMSDGVWCAEHKQTSLFQEKGYRYVLTSLSVGKIWWG